jgi:uncharacterized protein
MIARYITTSLLESLSYFPVIGLIGPRQVGKTTLARSLQPHISKPILYLDLENPTDANKLLDPMSYLGQHQDKCVIIDEVQLRPDLFPILRSLVDQLREPARFVLLGSASPYLIKNNTETLAGRIAYHELTPFLWPEISNTHTMQTHWFCGGFPGALLAPTMRLTRKWQLDFIDTFVTRDVKQLQGSVPETKIANLIRMVAHLHGGLLNMSQLANSLDISQPTVTRYLDLLDGSFLIRRLQPFYKNLGKRLVKSPKIYIRDSGLLHRLSGLTDQEALLGYPQLGASWEGYVIEQIISTAEQGSHFYFYRTSNGAEIDLVWQTANNLCVCIEIKYSSAPSISKGFYEACADIKPNYKYVIIPSGETYSRADGTNICSLPGFLSTEMARFGG